MAVRFKSWRMKLIGPVEVNFTDGGNEQCCAINCQRTLVKLDRSSEGSKAVKKYIDHLSVVTLT